MPLFPHTVTTEKGAVTFHAVGEPITEITPLDALALTVRTACSAALAEGTSTPRIKAETAERVLGRIASGEIALSVHDLIAVNERMNRASGTADRSVAVSMLEVIIGVGIRRAV
jgi:hypothetical protein